jgi:hypothetical protein
MLECLLNIAYHLEHRDCLALEVCCKSFREILFKSPFHNWKITRYNTSNGYRLESPNGTIEHELQIVIGTQLFLEAPIGVMMAVVTRKYNGSALTVFYSLEDDIAHTNAFIWQNQLWMIVSYGMYATPWWPAQMCRIGLCRCDLQQKPISRANCVFDPSIDLDYLGNDFAKYISSLIHMPRTEL